jgi:hypothetical protein
MPGAAELATPPLRKTWTDAKKKSEEAAKKSKETDKLEDLHKKKMKGALGPDLEDWPKKYPDWNKLNELKKKIDVTLHTYSEAVKGSGLTDPVKKPMAAALLEIKTEMDERLKKAEELVNGDMKLGLKLSKKAITPIIVFQMDVARQVDAKAPKAKYKAEKILLEVILSDDRVIKNVPNDLDDGHLAEEIRNAASFSTIIDDLADLLNSLPDMDEGAASKKFEAGMDKVIQDALARAAKPILELVKVRSDYTMYKVKKGATLTLAVAGVVASIVTLATTPFTGGVSTIAGCVGLAKSISTISAEVNKLALSAEGLINKVTGDISTLNKQYITVSGTVVGVGELGKTTVNSIIGPFFTTIKDTKTNCDQVVDKINSLVVKSHDQSQDLGGLLTEQSKMQKALSSFEQMNKGQLTPEEIKIFLQIQTQVEKTTGPIDKLIKGIPVLVQRVEKNKGAFIMLKRAIDFLAAKEPTWAKVGEVLIQTGASIGFIVAGNVNVPEPMEILKVAHTIGETASRVLEPLNIAKELAESLEEMVKKHKKK